MVLKMEPRRSTTKDILQIIMIASRKRKRPVPRKKARRLLRRLKPKKKRHQREEYHLSSKQQPLPQSNLRPRLRRNQLKISKRILKMKDLPKRLFLLLKPQRIKSLSMIISMERKAMVLRMVQRDKRAKKLIIMILKRLMLLQLLPQRLLDQLNWLVLKLLPKLRTKLSSSTTIMMESTVMVLKTVPKSMTIQVIPSTTMTIREPSIRMPQRQPSRPKVRLLQLKSQRLLDPQNWLDPLLRFLTRKSTIRSITRSIIRSMLRPMNRLTSEPTSILTLFKHYNIIF
jgi:hypothetical protein